jgi:nucleotide-binding universal stress UspA family protein
MIVDRILVGVDFRPPALAAARWAAASFGGAREIELVHVTPVPELESRGEPNLREGLNGLASSLGLPAVTTRVLIGQRAARLVERVRELDPDLVVLGRSTVDGIRGRTIERLIRQLEVPVVAVGCGPPARPQRVVAAVDRSPISVAVVEWARELARGFEAGLTVIHVETDPAGSGSDRAIGRWLRELSGPGAEVSVLPGSADPGSGVLQMLAATNADLLVVGRNGAHAMEEREIGTVTGMALRRAGIPMVVVPDAATVPRRAATRSADHHGRRGDVTASGRSGAGRRAMAARSDSEGAEATGSLAGNVFASASSSHSSSCSFERAGSGGG